MSGPVSEGDMQGRSAMPGPLPRSFYARDVVKVARELLGKRLIRTADDGVTVGRIVEVEAYLARGDAASHSYRCKTRRNASTGLTCGLELKPSLDQLSQPGHHDLGRTELGESGVTEKSRAA